VTPDLPLQIDIHIAALFLKREVRINGLKERLRLEGSVEVGNVLPESGHCDRDIVASSGDLGKRQGQSQAAKASLYIKGRYNTGTSRSPVGWALASHLGLIQPTESATT
jgi:hypothetical protein